MGKLILWHLLFLAFIANSVQLDRKDAAKVTFTWAEGYEKNGKGPAVLNIAFPDGGPDDQAVLLPHNPIMQMNSDPGDKDEVDPCILKGYLRDEDDVYVSINGCPKSKDFEIGFDSNRLSASLFKVVNGKTVVLSDTVARSLKARIDVVANPDFDEESFTKAAAKEESGASWKGNNHNHCTTKYGEQPRCQCHCEHHKFTMGIAMMYSNQWYGLFKGGSVNALRRVLNMVQNIFYWKSSPLRLTVQAVRYQRIGRTWTATAKWLTFLSAGYWPYANYYGANVMALMTYENNRGGVVGITYKPSICGYYAYKGMIAEFLYNHAVTAEILAHQIGHSFGIGHDYGANNSLRRDKAGRRCSGMGGIMDHFARWPRTWSTCSCQDWCKYYNFVMRTRDRFCLDCKDRTPFCGFVATMPSFFCASPVVKRQCPRACGLCGNVINRRKFGTKVVSNMKMGEGGPGQEQVGGSKPEKLKAPDGMEEDLSILNIG